MSLEKRDKNTEKYNLVNIIATCNHGDHNHQSVAAADEKIKQNDKR